MLDRRLRLEASAFHSCSVVWVRTCSRASSFGAQALGPLLLSCPEVFEGLPRRVVTAEEASPLGGEQAPLLAGTGQSLCHSSVGGPNHGGP